MRVPSFLFYFMHVSRATRYVVVWGRGKGLCLPQVGPNTAIQPKSMAAAAAPVFAPGLDMRPVKVAMKMVCPIAPAMSHVRRPSFSMNVTPMKFVMVRTVVATAERADAVTAGRPM